MNHFAMKLVYGLFHHELKIANHELMMLDCGLEICCFAHDLEHGHLCGWRLCARRWLGKHPSIVALFSDPFLKCCHLFVVLRADLKVYFIESLGDIQFFGVRLQLPIKKF